MSDYISEKIEQYERKLKQAEKAGKHHKAKKYAARAAGEHDSVRRLPGTTEEGSLRDLELRAAILGYGLDAGDDSGRVVVQPRAIAARTRSL